MVGRPYGHLLDRKPCNEGFTVPRVSRTSTKVALLGQAQALQLKVAALEREQQGLRQKALLLERLVDTHVKNRNARQVGTAVQLARRCANFLWQVV